MEASADGVRVKDWDLLLMRGLGQRAESSDASVVVTKTHCAHRAETTTGAVVGKSGSRADSAQIVKERGIQAFLMRCVVLRLICDESCGFAKKVWECKSGVKWRESGP